jgi:hypothetical protein
MNKSQRNLLSVDKTVPEDSTMLNGYTLRHDSSSRDYGEQREGPGKLKRKWLATSGGAYQIEPGSKQIFPSFIAALLRPAAMRGLDRTTDNDAETTARL